MGVAPRLTVPAMTEVTIPIHAIKGRGTATRLAHRFERDARLAYDDGWGTLEADAVDAVGGAG